MHFAKIIGNNYKTLILNTLQTVIRIHTLEDISELPKEAVVSVGMFDGVHLGHRKVLLSLCSFAKELCTKPLAITFDRHPRLVLSNGNGDFHLLNTNPERYRIMEQCGIGDVLEIHFTPEVAALSACQFAEEYLVEKLAIKGLLLGYDNMFGNKAHNDFDRIHTLADTSGFAIRTEDSILCDSIEISSTQIRKALARGDISLANRMLGYSYSLEGTVVEGRKVGRTLDFPTANILLDNSLKMLPAEGVYCVTVCIDGQPFKAMCNVGAQPTFNSDNSTLEVNIFDFHNDIYGKTIALSFLERLRDIRRFDTPQALVNQLVADKEACLNYFDTHETAVV